MYSCAQCDVVCGRFLNLSRCEPGTEGDPVATQPFWTHSKLSLVSSEARDCGTNPELIDVRGQQHNPYLSL